MKEDVLVFNLLFKQTYMYMHKVCKIMTGFYNSFSFVSQDWIDSPSPNEVSPTCADEGQHQDKQQESPDSVICLTFKLKIQSFCLCC